jgi:hypothetical protein
MFRWCVNSMDTTMGWLPSHRLEFYCPLGMMWVTYSTCMPQLAVYEWTDPFPATQCKYIQEEILEEQTMSGDG